MKRASELLFFLFVILLPTQLGIFFFFEFSLIHAVRTDYLAPAIYLTDLVALALILINLPVVVAFFHKRMILIVLGLLGISAAFAYEPWVSVYRIAKVVEWLAVFAIARDLARQHLTSSKSAEPPSPFWRNILISLCIGTVFELGLALAQLQMKQSLQGVFYWFGERQLGLTTPDVALGSIDGSLFLRPYATFSHPNSMAGFYLLQFFFVPVFPAFRHWFRLRALTLAASAVLVFLGFSKVAIGTFVLLTLGMLVVKTRRSSCVMCSWSRIVILVVVAFVFMLPQGDPDTVNKRIVLAENAMQIIMAHPLTGTGPGNYLYAQAEFLNRFDSYFLQPVHNIPLLFLAETGLLGAGIVALTWKRVIRLFRNRVIALCTAAVFLTGLLDHYWYTLQQNFLLTAVVFGILVALQIKQHNLHSSGLRTAGKRPARI
ncbi:MAG: O-antigen ligase family protein [Patescibacteria group bacterium]|nr:O-antigen ligase family protein [Patescibacteria group bacterium]